MRIERRLFVLAFALLVCLLTTRESQSMTTCGGLTGANACGTDGLSSPNIGFVSANGADVQMVGIADYFCWLKGMAGNWQGLGPVQQFQGVRVVQENDGYWHLVTNTDADIGWAQCSPSYCFSAESGGNPTGAGSGTSVVTWDNQTFPTTPTESVIASNPLNVACSNSPPPLRRTIPDGLVNLARHQE